MSHQAKLRAIPSIDELRQREAARTLEAEYGARATVEALRAAAGAVRQKLRSDQAVPAGDDAMARWIESEAGAWLRRQFSPSLVRAINATGVVLHTNLGRAPLAESAIQHAAAIAGGYSTLEYDLARGRRGRRDVHAERLLCALTSADAAVVVNNNAAATLIVLAALAAGREVVVSRGELVEIGGGFRVPDVMAQSGAILREVGTTNRTRAADYAAAINDRTALLLRVHPSNFTIEGFTERPAVAELVAVGRRFGVPVVEDLGSGYLGGDVAAVLADEPSAAGTIAAGVDVCCFSGDKLLGGPQAGIILGRTAPIDRIRSHPLMRALRPDKLTLAALEATLAEYAAGRARRTVPVQRMLSLSGAELRGRAESLGAAIAALPGWRAELVEGTSAVGGGSAPGIELPTWLISIQRAGASPDTIGGWLRSLTPPIVARIERDRVLLDLRTVEPDDDDAIRQGLESLGKS